LAAQGGVDEARRTNVYADELKCLQVHLAGDVLSPPILRTDQRQVAEISFDILGHDYHPLSYIVEHCDADWKPSQLATAEFLDGMPSLITDYTPSRATTTLYTHYRMTFPNDEVRPRISGNYALRVFSQANPSRMLLTACISVTESLVMLKSQVTGMTLTDFNREHQQVDFQIITDRLSISNPAADLKIRILQNRRFDNMAVDPMPTGVMPGRITYDPNRALIFAAGNEYRRFEFLTASYNGMGVENTRFYNPYYHVTLQTLFPRPISYEYDQDQNGRYFIRCSRCTDYATEADYYFVHFSLKSPQIPGGNLYIMGDLTYNMPDLRSQMEYNAATESYEKHLFLKQGHYNYALLFVPNGRSSAESAPIERNFYQTENEYYIYVYYRPFGARYDRLIAFSRIDSSPSR
jgi:hypothetical protein